MQIKTEFTMIGSMRTFVAAPVIEENFPAILVYSDIFQLSTSFLSFCKRLASYGFVVAAPEIFHRHEAAGIVLEQNDEGRAQGSKHAITTTIEEFDEDAKSVIGFLKNHPSTDPENIGSAGFCIGGHLAFRVALQPVVKAATCFYPTWLHNGKLGKGEAADSLTRATEIEGKILIIFGTLDPLIPEEARTQIINSLNKSKVKTTIELLSADHGFMRDDRPAFDGECVDQAFAAMLEHFDEVFSGE
jgi:carboxymethylenebutenolidase